MRFQTEAEAVDYVFQSLSAMNWQSGAPRSFDEDTRDPRITEKLLQMHHLLETRREYAVVTGSKGKGSVTLITAHLLRQLGHTVGTITSPHFVSYRERIRVNGRMISEADFVRVLDELAPSIDSLIPMLPPDKYLSPQGIFLAMALKYFDEQKVTAAVIEVGRGGRYDDNAVVSNKLSMFTPILLEHTRYLGETVERIAWHKAGIIKPQSYAYSLPQPTSVLDMLRAEADTVDAEFEWVMPLDMGQYIEDTPNGIRMELSRYGEINLPLYGRYEIDNATLAVWGAGNMHGRLKGVSHGSDEYVQAIRTGLQTVVLPGRCQKLQDNPAVFIDGAINTTSVSVFLNSVRSRLTAPVVIVTAVPTDRDYPAVYAQLAPLADTFIVTSSNRNITIDFPDQETALNAARTALEQHGHTDDLHYTPTIAEAVKLARSKAGTGGTVLMAVAQPVIGDAMAFYGLTYEQL